jgi:hypothetical protein
MHPLQDARRRSMHWLEIARAVRQLEQSGASDTSGETPIRMAERLSGYSANQLRRMLMALRFLDELALSDQAVAEWLGTPRFSIGEMLGKLWRQDRDTTLRILRGKPVLRYQSLYRLFHDTAGPGTSPISTGKRAKRRFEEAWLKQLSADPQWMAPYGPAEYTLLRPRTHHRFCKPALLLRAQLPYFITRWTGLDFIDQPSWNDDAMWRRLMAMATEATFLDAWCLIVAQHPEIEVNADATRQIEMFVHELGLPNLIIVRASDGGKTEPFPLAPLAFPVPDRRAGWRPPRLDTVLLQYTVKAPA